MKHYLIGVLLGVAMLMLGGALMVLFLFASARKAHAAEVFVEGAAGYSFFQKTTPDGVWWQQPFPHSFDLRDGVAWKAGLGLRFNEHWSVTGSYVSLGEVGAKTEAVSDHDYDAGRRSGPRINLSATDRLAGPQLVTSYRWTQWPVQPFLSGGMALMHHYGAQTIKEYPGVVAEFHGDIPMLVVGGGLCYRWLCGEVTYYRGVHAPNYPISTEAVVPTISLKIPLWGF